MRLALFQLHNWIKGGFLNLTDLSVITQWAKGQNKVWDEDKQGWTQTLCHCGYVGSKDRHKLFWRVLEGLEGAGTKPCFYLPAALEGWEAMVLQSRRERLALLVEFRWWDNVWCLDMALGSFFHAVCSWYCLISRGFRLIIQQSYQTLSQESRIKWLHGHQTACHNRMPRVWVEPQGVVRKVKRCRDVEASLQYRPTWLPLPRAGTNWIFTHTHTIYSIYIYSKGRNDGA